MANIEFDGLFNLRDVGGLPTLDGGRIQPGRLYRSGTPNGMTVPAARRAHSELGIQTVIDLRHPDELLDAPSRGPLIAAHVTRHHISPVSTERSKAEQVEALNLLLGVAREQQTPERYFIGLQSGGARYAEAAQLLTESTFPVLIHCTAGKDRTGILVGLLLEVAGVPPEEIGLDYEKSNAAIDRLIAHSQEFGRNLDESREELTARWQCPAERMAEFLGLVREEFGSGRGFFRAHGLSDAELDTVRRRLVGSE